MSFSSIGDLAKSLQFRTNNSQLREKLSIASTEMATGRRSDVGAAVGGDFSILAGIERSDRLNAVYLRSSEIAASQASSLQASLDLMSGFTTALGSDLAATAALAMPGAVDTQTVVARQGLDTAIAALNVRVGEGYLLAGQRSDQQPVPDADQMLGQLRIAVAGLATADEVAAAVDAWFAAPAGGGGYLDFYQGDAGPVARHKISDNQTVSFEMTATDPAFRSILAGLAVASLAGDGALQPTVQAAALLGKGGERLVGTTDALEALRSRLGRTEQTIEDTATRTRANTAALALVRANLTGVDTADAATDVVSMQNQLEALYTLTARVQQMKLVNYL